MKIDFSCFVILLILVSCASPSREGYEIKGHLQNGAGKLIYIDELTTTSVTTIDSALVDEDGNYSLTGKIGGLGFYRIRLDQNNYVNIILNPQDQIELNGDASYLFGNYEVKGSRDALLLYEINEYFKKIRIIINI